MPAKPTDAFLMVVAAVSISRCQRIKQRVPKADTCCLQEVDPFSFSAISASAVLLGCSRWLFSPRHLNRTGHSPDQRSSPSDSENVSIRFHAPWTDTQADPVLRRKYDGDASRIRTPCLSMENGLGAWPPLPVAWRNQAKSRSSQFRP